jgi:hypothetical protein
VKKSYAATLREHKQRIARRLRKKNYADQPRPMFQGGNVHYEVAARTGAVGCGGLGAVHTLAQRLGLVKEIDGHLHLLKVHLPYHESDHVLNFAYNILAGGVRLEDLELRRQDEPYMNGLGAQRIPDPTTAGDFTRRFAPDDILTLQECINRTRQKVWSQQPAGFLTEAYVDVDGTIAGTLGECKGGMDISYKGIWGYAPLIVSLANTSEVLYLVNRPGNAASHADSVPWIDRAIALVGPRAGSVTVRGDTDFTHTAHLDRWDAQGTKFILGMDAHAKVVGLAEALPAAAWRTLERLPRYEILTEPRTQPVNVKEQIVKEREYKNIVLMGEDIAEFSYQPNQCDQSYRLVVVRKNLSVQRGEKVLFDEVRYFFYITNREDLTVAQVVELANQRCHQENLIAQLKGTVQAMRMPVNDLNSNWAYMVMATLAWNLKGWFALLVPDRAVGLELLKMEFRTFLQAIMALPAQIVRTARKLVYRFLGYNRWVKDFLATFARIRRLAQSG